jgi:hypothetical protein
VGALWRWIDDDQSKIPRNALLLLDIFANLIESLTENGETDGGCCQKVIRVFKLIRRRNQKGLILVGYGVDGTVKRDLLFGVSNDFQEGRAFRGRFYAEECREAGLGVGIDEEDGNSEPSDNPP